ncbi:zf-HC2 domain-containing protein [Phytohabitans rumicis]|uniref:Putative zinc-finger domain-containing protein n=1 Tax=Phytohabitans rumicis TaxID=1076125 RepID=A0A6V8LF66_9ACTN|nr:zf-HC2 domain-containing protein [Phytohabitans rumicis]GFJ94934.1 hypothetical protein Prum_085760 [Phytohabitans rumicis]
MFDPCVHPDVGAYALGLLEPDELAAYERHLRGCADCTRTLAGLDPLVQLLGTVDAASLVAATGAGMGHRFPERPPEPVVTLVQRPRPAHPYTRRLTLAAAAAAVVVLVGLVTYVARSSVHTPVIPLAEPPPGAAAATATTAPPPRTAPASNRPAATTSPPRRNTGPEPSPPRRTPASTPTPTPGASATDTIKVGPAGGNGNAERYDGSDPATGTTAQVEVVPTAAGADVTLTLAHLSGPREGTLLAVTTKGTTETALRWRIPAGTDEVTLLGGTTSKAFERFDVVDENGRVLVTIPVNSK